jgi:hypothetical protein
VKVTFISDPDDEDYYSDDIECARCGKRFYYELLECPHCGARVYSGFDEEEDDLLEEEHRSSGYQSGLIEIGSVLSSWFIAALLITVLFLPLRNAFTIQPDSLDEQGLLFIIACLAGIIAGWLVVRFAGRRWKLYGLLAGAGSIAAAAVLYWILHAQLQPLLASPITWVAVPVILGAGYVGAGLADRMFRTADTGSLFGSELQEKVIYRRLLAITRNDPATAERLIAYEKKQLPRASRLELMQRAVQRWERDNR